MMGLLQRLSWKLQGCGQCGGREQVMPEWVTLEDSKTTLICRACWKKLPPLGADDPMSHLDYMEAKT